MIKRVDIYEKTETEPYKVTVEDDSSLFFCGTSTKNTIRIFEIKNKYSLFRFIITIIDLHKEDKFLTTYHFVNKMGDGEFTYTVNDMIKILEKFFKERK